MVTRGEGASSPPGRTAAPGGTVGSGRPHLPCPPGGHLQRPAAAPSHTAWVPWEPACVRHPLGTPKNNGEHSTGSWRFLIRLIGVESAKLGDECGCIGPHLSKQDGDPWGSLNSIRMFLNEWTTHLCPSLLHVLGGPSWVVRSLLQVFRVLCQRSWVKFLRKASGFPEGTCLLILANSKSQGSFCLTTQLQAKIRWAFQ